MSVWRVILATFVIFCAGLIAGGVAVHHFESKRARLAATNSVAAPVNVDETLWPKTNTRPVPSTNSTAWKRLTLDFLKRFEKEVELTSEQRDRIEVIITESQKRTKEMSDQLQPRLRDEVKHAREQIRAELNPEQRKKYDAIYKARMAPKKEKKAPGSTNEPPASATRSNPDGKE